MQTCRVVRFSILLVAAAVGLSAAARPARAAVYTWANLGSTWSTAANWGGTVPTSNSIVAFNFNGPYSFQPSLTAAASVGGLWDTGSGTLAIGGSALTLSGTTVNGNAATGIEMDSAAGNLSISSSLVLGSAQQWLNNSGVGALAASGGTVNNGGFLLTIAGSGNTTVGDPIIGAGGLTQAGPGQLTLAYSNNSYTGPTTISGGTLQVGSGPTGQASGLATSGIADNAALVYSSSGNQTAAYCISGLGSLTKFGTGTLTLSNSNTYTGLTTIGGGTLQLGAGVAGQDGTLATSGIADNGTLTYNLAGNQTAGYVISGAGSLRKAGNGTLTLSASETYSGTTVVSAGTLVINGSPGNSGSLPNTSGGTVAAGATLQVNGNTVIGGSLTNDGIVALVGNTANTLSVSGATTFKSSVLDLELGSSGTLGTAGEIVVKGAATVSGVNDINLTSISGQPVVSGSYTLVSAASGLDPGGNSNKFQLNNQPAGFFTPSLNQTSKAITLVITANPSPANAYWTGAASQGSGDVANNWAWGSGLATPQSNWSTTPNGQNDALQVPASTTNVFFTAANATATGGSLSTQLDQGYTINSLTFGVSAGTITSVAINTNGSLLSIGSGGLTLTGTASSSAAINGSGGVVVNGSQVWANNSNSQSLTVSTGVAAQSGATMLTLNGTGSGGVILGGNLSDGGGTLALNSSQSGVTRLSGLNTYSGGTTISTGTLNINSDAALGAVPTAMTANVSFTGNGSLQFAAGANLAPTRGLGIGNGFTATLDTQGNSVTINGPITGGGNVTQVGAGGTLLLTNTNTYTGATNISTGTLQLGSGASGQDGTLTTSGITNNGAIVYNLYGAQTAGYNIGGSGSLTKLGGGNVILTGTNSYSGGTNVNGGLLEATTPAALANYSTGTISVGGSGTLAVQVLAGSAANGWTDANITSLENNSNVTFAAGGGLGIDVVAGATYTPSISLAVSPGGANQVVKLGAGVMVLTSPNTYTGSTTISAGTLQLGKGISGNDGSLASASIIDNGSLVFALFANQTYSGAISGGGSVATTGSSTLTLSGINTYVGSTTVSGGTLMVNGALNPGGAVVVSAGGVLGGSGTAGSVTLANGSSIDVSHNNGSALSLTGLTLGLSPTDTSTLTFTSGVYQTMPELAIGGGGVTNGGAVTVNVNTTLALSGTYALATYPGTIGGAGSSVFNMGSNSGLNSRQSGSLLVSSGAIDWVVGIISPIWTGLNGSQWVGANNWKLGNNGAPTSFQSGDSDVFDDSAGTAGGTTNVTINGGNVSPGSVTFNNNVYNYTLSGTNGFAGAGGLTLNGAGSVTISTSNSYSGGTVVNAGLLKLGNAGALGTGPITLNGGALSSADTTSYTLGALSIAGSVTLGDPVNNGGLVFSGPTGSLTGNSLVTINSPVTIGNSLTGSGALTKAGSAALILSGSNTFSGGMTINAGLVEAGGNGLGTGPVTLNAPSLQFTAGSAYNTATISSLNLGPSSGTINVSSVATGTFGANEVAVQCRGIISGPGNLTVTGGALVNSGSSPYLFELGAQNSYAGATTVSNAIVCVNNTGGDGPSNILPPTTVLTLINNGWFNFDNDGESQSIAGLSGDATGKVSITNANLANIGAVIITPSAGSTYTFAGVLGAQTILAKVGGNGTMTLTINGAGTQILSGVNTYSNSTSILSGTLQLGNGGATGSIASSAVTDNGVLAISLSTNVALTSVISATNSLTGSGVLVQLGPGMLMLTTSNGYSGGTTVSGGTLQLDSAGAVGSGGLTAAAGVTDFNGYSLVLPALNGAAGRITNSGTSDSLLTVNQSTTTLFGGSISNGLTNRIALALTGTGTLILSGTDTYSGGTTLDAGALLLASPTALADGSSLTVGQGASSLFAPALAEPSLAASPAEIAAVPEPGTVALLCAGLGGLLMAVGSCKFWGAFGRVATADGSRGFQPVSTHGRISDA